MRLPKTLTIAVPLAALALAGCGGGGDDDSTAATTTEAAPALTKADLISQGDAICAEVNAAVGAAGASEAEVPEQITQVADLYIGMVESIKRLGAPDEPAGYAEFIDAADALSAAEGEVKLANEREDTVAIGEASTKTTGALEEFQRAAEDYGFEECGATPTAPASTGSAAEAPPIEEEGGVEAAPELEEEAPIEEAAPEEEVVPETGGAGGGLEEAAPESGAGGGAGGGSSGGVGPG